MSNALHDYAKLFEKYAANNGGTGVFLEVEDCLSLANEMRMDADAIDAENVKLWELAYLVAEYVSTDQCEGCVTKRACNAGELDMCWIRKAILEKLHELGIEVG